MAIFLFSLACLRAKADGPSLCRRSFLNPSDRTVGDEIIHGLHERLSPEVARLEGSLNGLPHTYTRDEAIDLLRSHPWLQIADTGNIGDFIVSDNVTFAMNAQAERRNQIARFGFLNMYQAGRSSGHSDENQREILEANRMGLQLEEYRKIDRRHRPKYGYLALRTGTARIAPFFFVGRERKMTSFGGDSYFFKKDHLASRTSFYFGDSMDLQESNTALPWTNRFTPWQDRDLAVLGKTAGKINQTSWINGVPSGSFIELEFWDTLTLDDVEGWSFSEMPPAGEFLSTLRAHNIKIYKEDKLGRLTEFAEPTQYRPPRPAPQGPAPPKR